MAWSVALRTIFRYATGSARKKGGSAVGSADGRAWRRRFNQRCAVRVTYTPNRVAGQWKAHGRYLERESATQEAGEAGFDAQKNFMDVSGALQSWQAAGDPRLWKMIISPEFGERLDLQKLTRHVIGRMEAELGTRLQWVGVAHFNTEHPHVHVALRGVRDDGAALDLKREYVQRGIREIAEDGCTIQLGIRNEQDAALAAEREVTQRRFTSLDRSIKRMAEGGRIFNVAVEQHGSRTDGQHLSARLNFLQTMGLAEKAGPATWRVRDDFEVVLRAMQRATDRLKAHIVSGWGMTENLLVTGTRLDDAPDKVFDTDGVPVPGMEIRVVDAAGQVLAVDGGRMDYIGR